MEAILSAIGNPLIVLTLVFLVYWSTSWVKLALKGKLNDIFIQPISLIVGTVLAAFVLYNYSFRPLDMGEPKHVVVDFLIQGALLAGVSGVLYDKYLDKEENLPVIVVEK